MKKVSYTSTNTYETLNQLNPKTKNVWLVFHGIGYLSRYFLKYFTDIDPDEHYIIAPQAPSKYYLNGDYKHVGASWLTKEDTEQEIKNVFRYVDAVITAENIPSTCDINILGFSQGVSIATRYVSHSRLSFKKLILYAGGIPNELKPSDFAHIDFERTKVISVVGKTDVFLTPERLTSEKEKLKMLFGEEVQQITFNGGHEMKREIISDLAT